MKPYYDEDGITIYHGDCREYLFRLGRFDLLLTDPPYGIGLSSNPFRQKHAKSDWDEKPVDNTLLLACIAAADLSIVWGGNYFDLDPQQRFLIWDKVQPEDFSSAMCEQAWTNIPGPAKMFRRHVVSYRKWHPTQKPLELMKWCLTLAKDATTIIDPFAGSGTTLLAAQQMGRQAVGIELSEEYCEIAARRLSQRELFGQEAA